MTVRKRKDRGFWEYTFDLDRAADGSRRRIRKGGFKTRRDAEEAEALARNEMNQGVIISKANQTLGEYLDQWLLSYPPMHTKPSTQQRYEELVRLHIKPAIGNVNLKKLRPSDIDHCLRDVVKKGLSIATSVRVYSLLHESLKHAVEYRTLPFSPADAVKAPHAEKPETYTPTMEECIKLLEAAEKTPLGPYFRFAALTGIRRGEIFALHWQHIDFERGTVAVRGNVRRLNKGRGMVRMTPKREKSVRKLTLSPEALEILTQQKWRVLADKEKHPDDYKDKGIVFANALGGYRDPDHATRVWADVAEDCGLGDVRLHDMRHALATRLLERGYHAKVVQEILGHSNYSTTMNIYSHVTPGLTSDAMDAVGRLLGGSPDKEIHE
nr:H514 [uncultured bacterium]